MKNIVFIILGIVVSLIVSLLFMGVASEPVLIEDVPVLKHEDLKGFQIGAFTLDNYPSEYDNDNYLILKINDLYCVFISVLSNSDNINRLKNYLDKKEIDYYLKDISLYEETENMLEIESLMLNSSSDISFNELNKKIIKLFKETYIS